MSLDGIAEFLDKKSTMTEFGPLADISKEEELKVAGQKKTDRSLRRFEGEKLTFKFRLLHFDPLRSILIHFYSKTGVYFDPILSKNGGPFWFTLI